MRTDPLISALCVTHGRPSFVLQTVAWFQAQTWKRKELIVVDDSPKELRPDLRRAPNVRHIVSDQAIDMGAKHDRAIAASQGEIFTYWDDDDYFGPRRFAVQAAPIVLEEVTITGFYRDVVAVVGPGREPTFVRFKPAHLRPSPKEWLLNGTGMFRMGLHDGTAMFNRRVLRHKIKHPPYRVRQKVVFLERLADAGERWRDLPARDHFVYVRHAGNTWKFREELVLDRIARPWWIRPDVLDFWRRIGT